MPQQFRPPIAEHMQGGIRVVFATDVDPVEFICDVLCGAPPGGALFGVMSDWGPRMGGDSGDPTVMVRLCLPARRARGGDRLRCVFVLGMPRSRLMTFLHSRPLTVEDISKYMDRRETESIFRPIVDSLLKAKDRDKGASFRQKVLWVKAKLTACLRKLYRVSSSPQWMITMFGSSESQFVLTSAYYFFVGGVCTVETVGHLAGLFQPEPGRLLADVNTYQDLGLMYVGSVYAEQIFEFFEYVEAKLARDDLEARAIRACIDDSRAMFMLSDMDTIQYIYLAYHECFNAPEFMRYSQVTAAASLEGCPPEPMLVKNITGEFRDRMATYYNKDTYLRSYVKFRTLDLTLEGEQYNPNLFKESKGHYWIGTSSDMGNALGAMEREFPEYSLKKDLAAFMDLAGSDTSDSLDHPLFYLLGKDHVGGRMPVYRCEFSNRHYFVLPLVDDVAGVLERTVILPAGEGWGNMRDLDITLAIHYRETFCSALELKDQVYLSRHELFNCRLPVHNLVLDFDLKLLGRGIDLKGLYLMVCELRMEILDLLAYVGEVDYDHPVYFFKSTCPSVETYADMDEMSGYVERPYCTCTEKLGMRIITPLPRGCAMVGEDTVVSFVKVLNRLVLMNRAIVETCGEGLRSSEGPFDVGIYHRGRSIRLPYMYKVGAMGRLERMLKLFVCHPGDREVYVRDTLDPLNLLHHSRHRGWPAVKKVVCDVIDINEGFLTKKTMARLPKVAEDVLDRASAASGLSPITWIEEVVWPVVLRTLYVSFPGDKISQFTSVAFEIVSQSLVHIKSRGLPFKCLRFNHKSRKTSVRVFLILRHTQEEKTCITLMTQCFADKCNNNAPMAHFSVRVDTT
ncbi:DNA helicase-primase subunit B [Phascolarctid gammaherpesvirus 1]|uniref:DNA helicase-primase subunit B n=1 Tax=Phascolarctid gammaherpesvirus 1 TaxID=2249313 RepID=A0A3S8D7N9_9GAMA|nr:DNA helicase-primase subunit B [Phascolarctid gammaherpesvirus 1]AZB49227.1 DNA helicase-primase subunit B [Phascolarctid gammaherpesvirus 1]